MKSRGHVNRWRLAQAEIARRLCADEQAQLALHAQRASRRPWPFFVEQLTIGALMGLGAPFALGGDKKCD